jgi:hypothetical protein
MIGLFLLDLAKYHGSAMVIILVYALTIGLNMLIYAGVVSVGAICWEAIASHNRASSRIRGN